jgi:hypothetical protein
LLGGANEDTSKEDADKVEKIEHGDDAVVLGWPSKDLRGSW